MTIQNIKEDWDNVKKRYEAWWEHDMYDRPMICVEAPKKPAKEDLPNIANFQYERHDWRRKWTDVNYFFDKILYNISTTYYGGESIPVFSHEWAVGNALLFGCEPVYARETLWAEQLPIKQGENYPDICFDTQSFWWKYMLETTKFMCEKSKQRYFVLPMWGNHASDTFSIIRGSENLVFDFMDNVEWVRKNLKYISDSMIRQFDEMWKIMPSTGLEGSINYCAGWSPKKTMGFDSDFSCMVSPELFKRVILPPLIETMHTVDHRIYHLDGVQAAKLHLDTLLDIPEIDAIQWVPGDGNFDIWQWIPLVKKIQAAKKSVLIYMGPHDVLPILKELRPEGLCITVWGANSEDEANKLIEDISRF